MEEACRFEASELASLKPAAKVLQFNGRCATRVVGPLDDSREGFGQAGATEAALDANPASEPGATGAKRRRSPVGRSIQTPSALALQRLRSPGG